MATENLFPDGSVFSITGWTGTVTNVDEAPDGSWLTNSSTSADLRASFPTPVNPPTTGADLQTFRAYCRKDASGGGDPTITIGVRETGGGSDLATGSAATITSTTGEWITFTWDASLLSTSDGSAVEVYITGASGGGGPNRRYPEIDSIEWVADTSAPAFTGTIAATLDDATGAISGTHSVPVYTGSLAATLDDTSGALSGTFAEAQFTGSLSATLDDTAGSVSGTFTAPVYTGALAATLDDTTGSVSGTFTAPAYTGALAATLDDATGSMAGTFTAPVYTGALAATLDDAAGAIIGTFAGVGHNGTLAATLDDTTGVVSGGFSPPIYVGVIAATLDSTAGSVHGTATGIDATGTLAVTLDGVSGGISGAVSAPIQPPGDIATATVHTFGLRRFGILTFGLGMTTTPAVSIGGGVSWKQQPQREIIPFEQLLREDEELIAVIVAAMHGGVYP